MSKRDNAPMPIGLDHFQHQVGSWGKETFPESTTHSTARHIFREAVELCVATMPRGMLMTALFDDLKGDIQATDRLGQRRSDPHGPPEESADILLLLLSLAHKSGFSLLAVAHTKHQENQARRWGEPDAAGVVSHLEQP